MSMLLKNWEIARSLSPSQLRRYRNVHPVLAQVLYNRGLQDPDDAYHFLYDKKFEADPFRFKDMTKAVGRTLQAIRKLEPIAVYGDFDADGVTSTTLMMHVLRKLRANVIPYIPHRVDEGYGLNTPALGDLAKQGIKLVITVDCGIRSVQEVDDAKAMGLDIIITDHHSIGPEIPDAYAVVNPQQDDCAGEKRLAGVGVAFMFGLALLQKAKESARAKGNHRYDPKVRISDLLDLVAIGTVADIMPLNAALNRMLVQHGLDTINQQRRLGISALMEVAGLKAGEVDAMGIGFGLGPRINAAGRLDSAMLAYRLLAARNKDEAKQYADQLELLNRDRQKFTREAQKRIEQQLEDDETMADGHLIFAMDEHVKPGIVGLVAGRLTEAYYRPAVVVDKGETESHASCRSIPEFNITQALDECADLLLRHGGHAMAAGFTVRNENLPALRERLADIADRILHGEALIPTLDIDMELDIQQVNMGLISELSRLEPTGNNNEAPTFVTRRLKVMEHRTVGSDNTHLKLIVQGGHEPPIDCIGFRLAHWAQDMPACIDIAYRLEINDWQGRRNLQFNVQDIRPADMA